jgi:hypothetical protein
LFSAERRHEYDASPGDEGYSAKRFATIPVGATLTGPESG